jgi:hypothetical protein
MYKNTMIVLIYHRHKFLGLSFMELLCLFINHALNI